MAFTPILTYVLIGITILATFRAFSDSTLRERLLHIPFEVKHAKEYYRLLTHGFIHANQMHIFFNMYVFYMFGPQIEYNLVEAHGSSIGRLLFLGFYLGAILFATIPSMRKHSDNPSYRSLGASGAVSAVVMMFMFLRPDAQLLLFFIIPMPSYVAAIVFFAFEIFMNKRGNSFIAHDAHLWGAVFGIIFLLVYDFTQFLYFFQYVWLEITGLFS